MIKSAKGIIFLKNKYLLQLRDKKKNIFYPNFWGLFGGSLDIKETNMDCVEREIKEETNLSVKAITKILSVKFEMISLKKKRQIVYYNCKLKEKHRIILSEGQKCKFFTFKEIKKLNIVPMDFVAINAHYYKILNYSSKYH